METQEKLVNERLLSLEERITICESKISQAFEWLEDVQDETNSRK